jgi:hypothetical protein
MIEDISSFSCPSLSGDHSFRFCSLRTLCLSYGGILAQLCQLYFIYDWVREIAPETHVFGCCLWALTCMVSEAGSPRYLCSPKVLSSVRPCISCSLSREKSGSRLARMDCGTLPQNASTYLSGTLSLPNSHAKNSLRTWRVIWRPVSAFVLPLQLGVTDVPMGR